jgi:asparagine synthase (glutamine-hydrolysing)
VCGIGGILRIYPSGAEVPPPEASIPEAWLDIVDEHIKHRGPDGRGRFRDRVRRADGATVDVALVHRRMSIIDLAGGGQPMVSERGRAGTDEGLIAVVFNGCIYNHRDLRAELQAAGHRFETDHSDTEVLIHGWRQWGQDLPAKLEGMFAFAVWDRAKNSLLLARDHYGEKPLYTISRRFERLTAEYEQALSVSTGPASRQPHENEPSLAFASVPLALTRLETQARLWTRPLPSPHPDEPPWDSPCEHPIEDLLAEGFTDYPIPPRLGAPWPLTAGGFEVHGLDAFWPDGLFVSDAKSNQRRGTYESRALRRFPIFGIKDAKPRGSLTPAIIEQLLRQAVARRVEADVPLGAFLSGGVDSSLVSLFAKEAVGKLRTFCVRMPDPRYDESNFAARAAAAIGSDHTTLECVARPAEDLVFLINQLGIPFGDSSLLPTYWVSRAAREHVKVVLTGDGGDELFVGYERQMAYFLLKNWCWVFSLLPEWAFPAVDPRSATAKVRRLITASRYDRLDTLRWMFSPGMLHKILPKPRLRAVGWNPAWSLLQVFPALFGSWRSFSHALRSELDYLTRDLLRKVDTATMAVPLESRAPFLDTDLAVAVHAANPLDLIPSGKRKGLLKQVARKYFPAEIVDRPKMGFAIPIGEWFRTDYGGMKTLLLDHLNSTEPWGSGLGIDLNMKYVRQMLDEHMQERHDHSQRLYLLLVLSIWAKSQKSEGSVEAQASKDLSDARSTRQTVN